MKICYADYLILSFRDFTTYCFFQGDFRSKAIIFATFACELAYVKFLSILEELK
jgi:hypothetical protein